MQLPATSYSGGAHGGLSGSVYSMGTCSTLLRYIACKLVNMLVLGG